MDVLLLTYANNHKNPLQTLTEEYLTTSRTLTPRELKRHFLMHTLSHATLTEIAYYLTLFRDNLQLFLYSGHAGQNMLLTEDGSTRSEGLAHLLGACKDLKVVVLNGCSTAGQVQKLHECGIPVVIATNAPVNDYSATQFANRFFQALETGLNVEESFEQAIGHALGMRELTIVRSIGFPVDLDETKPVWGIFTNPAKKEAAQWTLPIQQMAPKSDYVENELLLNQLYDALSGSNKKLAELKQIGATFPEHKRDIIEAILYALPAPISEHVRKLLVPSYPGGEQGADVNGLKRLKQLVKTYTITIDFLIYILLAQLWDFAIQKTNLWSPNSEFKNELTAFLEMSSEQRKHCDYLSVLRMLRDALEDANQALFVTEIKELRVLLFEDINFQNACFFLETLRRQLEPKNEWEMAELCIRAEESLVELFNKLGFLGNYTLATVRYIDVQTNRNKLNTEFVHLVYKWHGSQGFYDQEYKRLPGFMDNRSVILLRRQESTKNEFLSLSPFILDENTFNKYPDDTLSKLYFFAGRTGERLFFKYINDPENEVINLDDPKYEDKKLKKTKFQVAKDQLNAFYKTVIVP
ncbi:MAG: CHAT domain-containing protein [Saprospiraceae bacterium]